MVLLYRNGWILLKVRMKKRLFSNSLLMQR
nr:MAG TPA: hypothetical protein [Caudoviricetes sp.]